MNMLKKLGWAAVLVTSGVPQSAVVPAEDSASAPAAPVQPSRPAAGPATEAQQPDVQRSRWGWPLAGGDEDSGEDEFEGEGWTFWGV